MFASCIAWNPAAARGALPCRTAIMTCGSSMCARKSSTLTAYINEEFAAIRKEEKGSVGVEIESTDPKTDLKTNPKAAELILDLIRKDPKITKKELSELTGLTESGVSYNIRKLRGEGKLDYIGSSKSGYWKVND